MTEPIIQEKDEVDSESNCSSDGEELTVDAIQKAYKTMFEKQLKVCKLNKALEDRVKELLREKEDMKRVMVNLKHQVGEK